MWFFAGNGTNATNTTRNATNATRVPKVPIFFNETVFRFQIYPNTTVNLSISSECSTVEISSSSLRPTSVLNASLQCSFIDPNSLEEGLTVVTGAVALDIPDPNAIVYPLLVTMTLQLAPTFYSQRRRLLLQAPSANDSMTPNYQAWCHVLCM